MGDLFRGANCFARGLSLMSRPGLRRYVMTPFLIGVAVFVALVWFGASQFGALVDYLIEQSPSWLAWARWLLWILFAIVAAGIVFFAYALVVGLAAAPFHGVLADATERYLTGRGPPEVPLGKTLVRLPITLLDELTKVAYSLACTLPILLLFLVPGLNVAAPFLWFVACAWVTGFGFADYALSNHGLKFAGIRRRLARRRMLTLGFGAMAFLAFMVPVFNLIAVPAAVCGGAVMWVEELARDESAA